MSAFSIRLADPVERRDARSAVRASPRRFEIRLAEDPIEAFEARLRVVGVGGSGCNAVSAMARAGLDTVELVAVNTDAQALSTCAVPDRIGIGAHLTRGLGAGANPEVGRAAALEDEERLAETVSGADLVFVTAGLGGGTGTGAAPVVARLARAAGALTVGVVTLPFGFEGKKRARVANTGLEQLAVEVDTLLVVTNDRLLELDPDLGLTDAFRRADEVLCGAVRGIGELVDTEGIVNVDFADLRAVMTGGGRALMGSGAAGGCDRARRAAETAVSATLLESGGIDGATGVLINVSAGPDVKLREIRDAAGFVGDLAHPEADIVFGARIDESLADQLSVTVIATGLGG